MTWWKDIANAIAHNGLDIYAQRIYIGCERCGCADMLILSHEQDPPVNEMEDIVLTTRYFLKCLNCGFEEMDMIMTIIPSWQWHPIRDMEFKDRKLQPEDHVKYYKEKVDLAKLWMK
jgi:hypothetical protein